MKLLLSSLLLLISISSYAQAIDSVDLVLYSDYSEWPKDSVVHIAKVEITRKRYERMLAENLLLSCKITTDAAAKFVLYDGQITVHHKSVKEPSRCTSSGCRTEIFEDLAGIETEAFKSILPAGPGAGKSLNYGIMSPAAYEKFKKLYSDENLPDIASIPRLTVYNPKIHTPSNLPVTDTFYCMVGDVDTNEIVTDF